jgi:hypothetical protein
VWERNIRDLDISAPLKGFKFDFLYYSATYYNVYKDWGSKKADLMFERLTAAISGMPSICVKHSLSVHEFPTTERYDYRCSISNILSRRFWRRQRIV